MENPISQAQRAQSPTQNKPWLYVPVLYFLQALPVSLVQDVSSLIYKSFGISNESITRWTAIVSLPWALQMLVGPFVDLNSTKRNWSLYGQLVFSVLLGFIALSLRLSNPFTVSLIGFFVLAIFSTLVNAATDGFYILSLDSESRAKYAGVQATCFRLGVLFCKGGLVYLAGYINAREGNVLGWSVAFFVVAIIFLLGFVESNFLLPFPGIDQPISDASESRILTIKQTGIVLTIGLSSYFALSALVRLSADSAWKLFDGSQSGPLHGWILSNHPMILGIPVGRSGIAAEIGQFLGCIFIFSLGLSWSKKRIIGTEFGEVFTTYFRQKGIVPILFFLMFYRFGEAMVVRMAPLFIIDKRSAGGLNLSVEQVGGIVGLAGMFGIIVGGLLGGWVVSRLKLRKCFWFIAIAMHVPNLLYLWASYSFPSIRAMYFISFIDQFGYGFGYAGYIIYQMIVAKRGHFPTSHFALGTGIGALFILVAFVMSGIIQSTFGYRGLFLSVIFMTIPGLLSLLFIPIDSDFEVVK